MEDGKEKGKKFQTVYITYIFLAISLLFMLSGILSGDIAEVYRKAANVCMECIGIG